MSERPRVELCAIVDRELSWDAEVADYVFPEEFLDILQCDRREGFGLDPFGQVLQCYHRVLKVAIGTEEWTD